MADQRTKRDSETREKTQRPSDAWKPSSTLPTPPPQDGYEFRWIRTSMFSVSDTKNVSKRFREGWVPVKADEVDDVYRSLNDIDSRFEGCIEHGGLLLCKIASEIIEQRRAYYEKFGQRQMESVDEGYLRDNNPAMRKFSEKKSRTEFGSGG
jgi:hypothetical protein